LSVSSRLTVLVTGATGAIGPRVVEALSEAGHHVRSLSIDAPSGGVLPKQIEATVGDITDADTVRRAVKGCDAVVHLAALLHIMNPPKSLRPEYERVNVAGTRNVVDAAMAADVQRVVYFSTVAVYGPTLGQVMSEESTPRPDSFYAETKLAAERIVLASRSASNQPMGTVLRLGAVYGSRIKGNYDRLVSALDRGTFVPIGSGSNRRTLLYDKDLGAAAELALTHPAAAGVVFNVTDGTYHTVTEIIDAICLGLGRKPPIFTLPLTPVRLGVGTLDRLLGSVGLRSPISLATIDKYTEDVAIDGTRIRRVLGYSANWGLQEGWRDTIDEMRCIGLS